MEITIIGWYGTETIGDRAILAGLFHIFYKVFGRFSIRMGSLFPFYTSRTIIEDMDFYKYCSSTTNLNITVFDSQNPFELSANILRSQLLVVGGGPLMDLREMKMLDFALTFARNHKKKSVLLGCGWGPLKNRESINIACRLVEYSSLTIFRDELSLKQYESNTKLPKKTYALIDPAFIACKCFLEKHKNEVRKRNTISVNFRDVALEGTHYSSDKIPDNVFENIIKALYRFNLPIKLVPMHNFFIGGDDREILARIKRNVGMDNVHLIYEPQSLEQTMSLYYHSKAAIGMRFHSIVLQTMLNGNNYIVDYTDPNNGKIVSMLKQLHLTNSVIGRYFSLYTCQEKPEFNLEANEFLQIKHSVIEYYLNQYVELIYKII